MESLTSRFCVLGMPCLLQRAVICGMHWLEQSLTDCLVRSPCGIQEDLLDLLVGRGAGLPWGEPAPCLGSWMTQVTPWSESAWAGKAPLLLSAGPALCRIQTALCNPPWFCSTLPNGVGAMGAGWGSQMQVSMPGCTLLSRAEPGCCPSSCPTTQNLIYSRRGREHA